MLLSALIVFILSAAAGCGIGGGGILVVYMTLVLGTPQLTSQATNLVIFIISALSSAIIQRKRHSLPDIKLILLCSSCALPGVLLGTLLRGWISSDGLKLYFGLFLIFAGMSVFWGAIRRHNKSL